MILKFSFQNNFIDQKCNFRLPLPPGHRFVNPQVQILPNGVIDVSGDLDKE